MVTAADLAYMRTCADEFLPDTCHVMRISYTPDGVGGRTQTWGTAGTSVPCRVAPSEGANQLGFAQQTDAEMTFIVSLKYNADALIGDRIVTDGRTLDVVGISDHSYQVALRLICREVK